MPHTNDIILGDSQAFQERLRLYLDIASARKDLIALPKGRATLKQRIGLIKRCHQACLYIRALEDKRA